MSGLISNMFQPDDEATSQSSQTTTIDGDTATGVEASPSVGVGLSGSYEDTDGTTHEWSNDTQIGTDVDIDAALGFTGSLTTEDGDSSA